MKSVVSCFQTLKRSFDMHLSLISSMPKRVLRAFAVVGTTAREVSRARQGFHNEAKLRDICKLTSGVSHFFGILKWLSG